MVAGSWTIMATTLRFVCHARVSVLLLELVPEQDNSIRSIFRLLSGAAMYHGGVTVTVPRQGCCGSPGVAFYRPRLKRRAWASRDDADASIAAVPLSQRLGKSALRALKGRDNLLDKNRNQPGQYSVLNSSETLLIFHERDKKPIHTSSIFLRSNRGRIEWAMKGVNEVLQTYRSQKLSQVK